MNKMKATFSLFLLVLVRYSLQCSPPGPNWSPLSTEELARRAPLVVQAYLAKSYAKSSSFALRSRRCLRVSQIYKGQLHPQHCNYICADRFGSGAACLSDLTFGRPYIVFLNKVGTGYVARYDDIHSAVVSLSNSPGNSVPEDLRKGLCCARNKDCDKQLPCRRSACGVMACDCGLHPKGSVATKGANPPGPPTGAPASRRPGAPGAPGGK